MGWKGGNLTWGFRTQANGRFLDSSSSVSTKSEVSGYKGDSAISFWSMRQLENLLTALWTTEQVNQVFLSDKP